MKKSFIELCYCYLANFYMRMAVRSQNKIDKHREIKRKRLKTAYRYADKGRLFEKWSN
jgi:hypothetical protein